MKYKYTLEKVHRKSQQVDNIHNPIQVQVQVKGSRKPKSNKFKTASHRSSASGFKLVIRILSFIFPSYAQVEKEVQQHIKKNTFPLLSFNPRSSPSLQIILSTTRPSLHDALSFASLFNITDPLSGIFSLYAAASHFLSPRAYTYSFKNLF